MICRHDRKTPHEMTRYILRLVAFSMLAAVLTANNAFGAYPSVRNFGKTEYKAGTQNWGITESEGKFMYFANNSGLLEFDGNSWALIPVANHTNVRSALYDMDSRRIWAGAFNEFGYYSLDSRGAMAYTSLTDRIDDGKGVTEIWQIMKSGDNIYMHDDSRVYIYAEDTVRIFEAGGKINSMACSGDRIIFAALGKGLMTINGNGDIERLAGCGHLRNEKICAILPAGGMDMLFVTEFAGLWTYSEGRAERLTTGADRLLEKAQAFCAATDGDNIAVGTVSDGVFIINRETMAITHLNTFSGLQNNSVLSVYFDIDRNLWLGLDKGIDYVRLNSPEASVFNTDKLYGTGYASIVSDGRLYLGTNQGLYSTTYDERMQDSGGIRQVKGISGQVWCLEKIHGTLFCGHDHGLFIVSGDKAERIPGVNGIWKIMENPFDREEILGCSYRGLFRLERRNGKWTPVHIKGFSEVSSNFEADSDGAIWMHHWIKGLFRLTLDEDRDSVTTVRHFTSADGLPTDRNNMANLYDGRIVFSSEGGFFTYDTASGRMKPHVMLNSLFNRPPVAVKIHESPSGDLLFLSGTMQTLAIKEHRGYGIDSLSLSFLQERRIPGFDNICWTGRDGFIINTEDGFSWIDINKLSGKPEGSPRHVLIKDVYVSDANDSLIFGSRTPEEASEPMKIPYRDNSLRFEFVCPQYAGKNAIEYSWCLEGYDKEWSRWSSITTKEYTGLPQGSYRFMVRAKDTFSPEISECGFDFSILPPWYMSKAAVAGYAVLLALGVWTLLNYMNIRSGRQAAEVEKKKEEEMKAQQMKYEEEAREKEKEIVMLRNQHLESDLKHKSQDLADSTMNLIRKNEILIKIKNDISKVQTEISENDDRAKALRRLQKIQTDIRENIDHDDSWQKFEHNFDSVYENYLKRLRKEFPRLTGGDMRLCAYLKMNLSSKDIASMMNMSVRSVEMARYRLRQKLGLTRESNLSDFLQNF